MGIGAVATGLDVLVADPAVLSGRRFAVLANQAAITSDAMPAWLALAGRGLRPVRLFAPEHGIWGTAQDMEAVGPARELSLALEIHSLYGGDVTTLAPSPELLADLEAVVVDVPDIGCRYYTFAATTAHVMAACETAGVEVVICDRPNPIGGRTIEGGPVEDGCRSFVSELPVPVRHGMTLGELALLLQARRHRRLTLTVIPCRDWQRTTWWDGTGLPWVAPSPNIPTLTTATVYPGACLVEATNLSEGRGTTRPFQLVGAPWIDAERLAARLGQLRLSGVLFRATAFRPEFQKHAGEVCHGVEWHVTDRGSLRPLEVGLQLLREIRELHPDRFAWREEPYEFVADVPAIDLLSGSPRARAVVEGVEPLADVVGTWDEYGTEFREERREFLLYSEETP